MTAPAAARRRADEPPLSGSYLLVALNSLGTNVFFLGLYFHARISHGFSDSANLMLAAVQGAAYVLATRAGGQLADRVGAQRSVALGLGGMTLALLAGLTLPYSWTLFASVGLYSAATALTWPALEAAVARAPGRGSLAQRAGLYNITWSLVGAAGFFVAGPLVALNPESVFWVPLAAHALEIGYLALSATSARAPLAGTDSPTARLPGDAGSPVSAPGTPGPAGSGYLRSAWVANGLSYFLFGAFGALAPTFGERLGLAPRLTIWLVSAYLFARSATFLAFWLWSGWEYRRGWPLAALLLPPAALAAALTTTSPGTAIGALVVLGALSGVAYSCSLHASLDRPGREGTGGGLHEWVIGVGILLGPLAGAAGVRLFDGSASGGGLVAALGALAALAGVIPLAGSRQRSR